MKRPGSQPRVSSVRLRSPRRLLAAVALAAGFAGVAGCVGGPPDEGQPDEGQLFELYSTTATYLYEDDDLARAEEQAIKALAIDPEAWSMRRMIGWIRLRGGRSQDVIVAEQIFRELMDEGDEGGATVLGMATSLERLGIGYDDAAKRYTEDPEANKSDVGPEELELKARDYWVEARELYGRQVEKGEGNTTAMNGLQRVEALLGDYDKSLSWSELLLERAQGELEAWQRMLRSEDLTADEERLYRTNEQDAIELCNQTHLFAATILYELDRYEEAIQHLDAVARTEPGLAEIYGKRAQLLAEVGDYRRAIEDIDRYLRLSDEPFEHPNVRRAFELRSQYEGRL